MSDRLYMLRPGFFIGERGPLYCGDSLGVEGLLGFYPEIRSRIDVHYIDAERPRGAIVALLGEAHQSAPVLVLGDGGAGVGDLPVKSAGALRFIDDPAAIVVYLSWRFRLGLPA